MSQTATEWNHPMQITTIGVDLAKTIFQVHGNTDGGEVVFNRPLKAGTTVAILLKK